MAHFVEGIYQFELPNLPEEIALFNDGLPALIVLPRNDLGSMCRVQHQPISLGPIWFTAGAINHSYWLPPCVADGEKLTIVRFFPSAWQALFGKTAFMQPYVHSLATYHAELALFFNEIYLAPCLVAALESQLLKLCKLSSVDHTASAFDELAIAMQAGNARSKAVQERSLRSHLHPKWVQRQFKQRLGMSPYQFEQLQRFLAAYQCLQENTVSSLHAVADVCGYYDANHLVKDFNKYLGISPRQYFKKSVRH
ncbi:hypothetical protein GCM10017764_12400 [Sphingobacterium griseoflavum]|uniref:HTH araC/xylS-type domain-containing protein n=2 Tax=Sphingobacterium griseoflavum TaxID=1474952 RepID=A0ABQ3HWU7_9SPHI|nr:hypothetical protein GCM10017764_12400 [Sphingobacterium griseoflavum]